MIPAIVALMQANSSRPVRTFTIGFDEREYDEANHARAVAAHLSTNHTELRLSGADALALVPQMPAMYDEPFADSSQLPTHLVMKLARQHVTVAFSGDAGDELFGGYNRYLLAPRVWRNFGWMPLPLRQALGAGIMSLSVESINRLAGRCHTGSVLPSRATRRTNWGIACAICAASTTCMLRWYPNGPIPKPGGGRPYTLQPAG